MALPTQLQLILVTPERILLDLPVKSLRFPLYDGQAGIFPGRTPLVGRLGYGELELTKLDGSTLSYFVDGGFIQVNGPVVSLLTDRAIPAEKINLTQTETELTEARSRKPTNDIEFARKDRDQERARKMLALARKS